MLLSLAIWVPVFAGVLLLALGERHARWVALAGSILGFVVTIPLYAGFDLQNPGMQFVQFVPWIERFNVNYHLGVDGISMLFVLLNSFITVLVVIASWSQVDNRVAQYYAAFLILSGILNGVFSALDAVLFYVFFEGTLIPMFIIIGLWGGPNRVYASVKFFLYTLMGSLLMLVALLYLYGKSGGSFAILDWHKLPLPLGAQLLLFFGFLFAFAVKVPMWPVHTWLPDAHTEAPTAGSVILAGVLLKMGTYGLLRFNLGLFPEMSKKFAWVMITLAVIGIIYGALVAMVQPDVKRLVAYSSVSHMGFVVLGLFSFTEQGMQGALYQMLNHGVSTGALFLFVGMIYERRHTRMISEFGGLARPMPWFSALFVIASLSSIGLPFLNGFVGEFLIMLGSWTSAAVNHAWIVTMLAGTGVIWAAVYMLWMLQRVVFGTNTSDANAKLPDLNQREFALVLPLIALMLFMGVYPGPFLSRTRASIEATRRFLVSPQAVDSPDVAIKAKPNGSY